MKLVIGNKEHEIKSLTIGDYLDLKDDDINKIDDLELLDRFTTASKEEIKKIPYTKVKFIVSVIKSTFTNENEALPMALTLKLNDKWYGLIRPSELSYEEWINLEVFMTEKPIDLLKLATHLYKPLKSDKLGEERELIDYDLQECLSRQDEFRDMLMGNLTSALFFLITFVKKLTESLLDYTENQIQKNKK
jgi:hypothetical protein